MTEQRRLAAIVSADVAGYSRLMGRDESGTLSALKALRREVVDPRIATHGGRIVKTTGDGLLLEFPSVVEAVRCVVEVQTAMASEVAGVTEDRRIAFRIGINIGDIIIEGDDIFGNGVNIAARLQEVATPGGVCMSSRVHDDVRDRLETVFEDIGPQTLKNIARPVHVWRWRPGASTPTFDLTPTDAPLALPDKPSIAVLPFQNMSGDPEQEYFADGMVEDIVTALSRFKSLFVIARNSSFTYKGKAVDIKQVGRELGVRYVLEGSVRKGGGKVRITGQLIDAVSGAHLWAERFDGCLEDVFEVQDQVTVGVVTAIAPRLDQLEMDRVKRKPVVNLNAYDLLLRAMSRRLDRTVEARQEALQLYYRAIELDPGLASAYAGAAHCYGALKHLGAGGDPATDEAEVRRLVRLMSLAGRDDPRALIDAAYALMIVCHELDEGSALADEALTLNPNMTAAWGLCGWASVWMGQHEAALRQFAQAIRLGPRDPDIVAFWRGVGVASAFLGRYAEAMSWLGKTLSRWPDDLISLRQLALVNALAGDVAESKRIAAQVLARDPEMRLARFSEYFSVRRAEDIERAMTGLRLAGFPE